MTPGQAKRNHRRPKMARPQIFSTTLTKSVHGIPIPGTGLSAQVATNYFEHHGPHLENHLLTAQHHEPNFFPTACSETYGSRTYPVEYT